MFSAHTIIQTPAQVMISHLPSAHVITQISIYAITQSPGYDITSTLAHSIIHVLTHATTPAPTYDIPHTLNHVIILPSTHTITHAPSSCHYTCLQLIAAHKP